MLKTASAGDEADRSMQQVMLVSPDTQAVELQAKLGSAMGDLQSIAGGNGENWTTLWVKGDLDDPWEVVVRTLREYSTHDLRGTRNGVARVGMIIYDVP
jgi:hypothetical protein